MEIVCIKIQLIRKATEETEQKKVQYNSYGGKQLWCKKGVQNQEGFNQKDSFLSGPCRLWKPHGRRLNHFFT